MSLLKRLFIWPAYRFILASVFFVGIAHIAFLPPFEGFDETAHWSSVTFWSSEGKMPIYGVDKLDKGLETYPGPMPYLGDTSANEAGRLTYYTYNAADNDSLHESFPPTVFAPGPTNNWQAQHPPLYYLALQPAYKFTQNWDWVSQFFVLRFTSWCFAFAGFFIGVEASVRWIKQNQLFQQHSNLPAEKFALIAAAWPFLVPQFFPEMARMGNDSMCLLFAGISWSALLQIEQGGFSKKWVVVLGFALGAGLWTKAFFVPICAGVGLYFLWRAYLEKSAHWIKVATTSLTIAIIIGGGWYIYKAIVYGNIIGGDEMLQFDKNGGVLGNFLHNASLLAIIRGLAGMAISFLWAGNWSLGRLSNFVMLVPMIVFFLPMLNSLWKLKSFPKVIWLPLFMAVPVVAGLCYHLMLRIALTGVGSGAPGWYLHILAPALATFIAVGWPKHIGMTVIVGLISLFSIYAWTLQLALFSGCAVKHEVSKRIDFAGSCVVDWDQMSALANPVWGGLLLCVALFCLAWIPIRKRCFNDQNRNSEIDLFPK